LKEKEKKLERALRHITLNNKSTN